MDSGNSGSMQSSSGGDDEYDSRADSSISAFFNSNNPPQPPPHHHHHQQQQQTHPPSSMFDPLSNFFDPSPRSAQPQPPPPFANPNSLLNLDMVWSKTLRSEPDIGGFAGSSSSPTQQFLMDQSQSRVTFPSNVQIPHRPDNAPKGTVPNNDHSTTTNTNATNSNSGTNMVRNPKKRSRASRRAPTTVLTTDTTNFRAMVQEFTGIPAPPFTSSPFPRTTRLDLFGTSSSSSPPPYLLRPFAQKLQPVPVPPSFLSPSSSSSSSFSTACSSIADHVIASATELTTSSNNNNINSSTSAPSSSTSNISYQLLNNINMQLQNPILNFQSLLTPKYDPLSNSTILGTKQHESLQVNPSNADSQLKMGVLEEFGLSTTSHHHHGLQNLVSSSSDPTLPRRDINNGDPANWGGDGVRSSEDDHHQHQGLLRSINGNYNKHQRVVNSNGKLNYSGSASSTLDFHGDEGTQNVTTRTSEGMVESWICSSD